MPRQIIRAISVIREYGLTKYKDPENYKKIEPERIKDAAYRHWLAYLDDPNGVDQESGLPHLWHCACNIAFLIEADHKPKQEPISEDRILNIGSEEMSLQEARAAVRYYRKALYEKKEES